MKTGSSGFKGIFMGKGIIKKRIKFCPPEGNACPELSVNEKANTNKKIVITDDFDQKVEMSKEQFHAFVRMAKNGELDKI